MKTILLILQLLVLMGVVLMLTLTVKRTRIAPTSDINSREIDLKCQEILMMDSWKRSANSMGMTLNDYIAKNAKSCYILDNVKFPNNCRVPDTNTLYSSFKSCQILKNYKP